MSQANVSKELLELLIRSEVSKFLLKEEPVRRPLNIPLPKDLLDISHMFKRSGKAFYLVGGSVRDALLGKEPKDLDIATDALPNEVVDILRQDPKLKILEIGKSFGVIKALTPEGNEYEIATFRRDIGAGRRPDSVEFTDIKQDAARRDLTINALFYDIENKVVLDYVGGMEDISRGIVRTVGDPDARFGEDRLRVLRAIRFAGRFGTRLDGASEASIKNDNSLVGVSGERIRDEFLKGIKSAKSVTYFLELISRFDLWTQVFPGLSVSVPESLEVRNVPVLLAMLLRDNDPKVLIKKLNQLKYPANEVTQVVFLTLLQELEPRNAYKLKKLFFNSHLSHGDLSEFAKLSGRPSSSILKAFEQYQPSVTGEELQAQGFSGKELGQELERRETEIFSGLV